MCCRLTGTSERLRPAMVALLQDKRPYDPTIRAETAYDYWHIRQIEYLAEGAHPAAFAVVLLAGLGHDAFAWGEQHLDIEDEPVGLLCSSYGVEKLIEEQYRLMKWLGLLPKQLSPSTNASGPIYLAGERLASLIKENPHRGILSFQSAKRAQAIAAFLSCRQHKRMAA